MSANPANPANVDLGDTGSIKVWSATTDTGRLVPTAPPAQAVAQPVQPVAQPVQPVARPVAQPTAQAAVPDLAALGFSPAPHLASPEHYIEPILAEPYADQTAYVEPVAPAPEPEAAQLAYPAAEELRWGVPSTEFQPIAEPIATGPDDGLVPASYQEEDMGWEPPPVIGPDGRPPWLDGPSAPWGTAPGHGLRRGLVAAASGIGLGAVVGVAITLLGRIVSG
jgi:hypothetical protein